MNERQVSVTTNLSLSSIGAIVFIAFLILKLTGNIGISWFWVFFPLWIVPAALLAIELFIVLILLIFDR